MWISSIISCSFCNSIHYNKCFFLSYLFSVRRRRGGRTPIGVEENTARGVYALVGMGPKEIPLRLNQVRPGIPGSGCVKIRQRRKKALRACRAQCRIRNNLTQVPHILHDFSLEIIVKNKSIIQCICRQKDLKPSFPDQFQFALVFCLLLAV